MNRKCLVLALVLMMGTFLLIGCGQPINAQDTPSQSEEETQDTPAMSLEEALDIAQHSVCVETGPLTDNAVFNDVTGTWWIDLDADKPGCAPACVVFVADKTAEVNWRCTGAMPPREDVEDTNPPVVPAPYPARDAALDYLREHYPDLAPEAGLTWVEEDVTERDLVGAATFRYTAGDWMIFVSFPVVNPEAMVYKVDVSDPVAGLLWQGEVDTAGAVKEILALDGSQPVICWGGFIEGLPTGAQFDDYLAFEGETGVGIEGADAAVADQIQALRDQDVFVHVWGKLYTPAIDFGGGQVVVTHLREDKPGPLPDPEVVEGWAGTVNALPAGAQHDDYFVLMGDFPARYGIDSNDEDLKAQLVSLRDSGELVRVWGQVRCGVPGVNGTQIEVTRIERVGGP